MSFPAEAHLLAASASDGLSRSSSVASSSATSSSLGKRKADEVAEVGVRSFIITTGLGGQDMVCAWTNEYIL